MSEGGVTPYLESYFLVPVASGPQRCCFVCQQTYSARSLNGAGLLLNEFI